MFFLLLRSVETTQDTALRHIDEMGLDPDQVFWLGVVSNFLNVKDFFTPLPTGCGQSLLTGPDLGTLFLCLMVQWSDWSEPVIDGNWLLVRPIICPDIFLFAWHFQTFFMDHFVDGSFWQTLTDYCRPGKDRLLADAAWRHRDAVWHTATHSYLLTWSLMIPLTNVWYFSNLLSVVRPSNCADRLNYPLYSQWQAVRREMHGYCCVWAVSDDQS